MAASMRKVSLATVDGAIHIWLATVLTPATNPQEFTCARPAGSTWHASMVSHMVGDVQVGLSAPVKRRKWRRRNSLPGVHIPVVGPVVWPTVAARLVVRARRRSDENPRLTAN